MSILLIRHGETAGNKNRVIQLPGIPLSEHGLGQAQRLGARLANAPIARILASDLARARMTAEALQRANGAPLVLTRRLHERNFGALRGTPYADLDFDPFTPGYHPPEGESWEQFHLRVDEAWDEVLGHAAEVGAANAGRHLAVVTHGLVCHSLVSRRLGDGDGADEGSDDGTPRTFGNTSVSTLEPDEDGRWRVVEYAIVAHLDDFSDDSERGGKA